VEQIDPATGQVMGVFDSVSDAARHTNIDRTGISKAINGTYKQAGGYIWRSIDDSTTTASSNTPRPIEQLDPVTGTVLRVFDSVNAAVRETTIAKTSLLKAANGIHKHAGGYLWHFCDDTDFFPTLLQAPPPKHVGLAKPVEQLDPETGTSVINVFESVGDAARQTNIGRTSISKALSAAGGGNSIAGGYRWRFVQGEDADD
jgi:hypothetical protein